MLTVFNVGQGDCCLLDPGRDRDCDLGALPLLIDAGPTSARMFARLTHLQAYQLMVTHSHCDHLGGVPALLRKRPPERILVPYWLPEIDRIFAFLRRHLPPTVHPIQWAQWHRLPIGLVAHGDTLCGHATILNPPRHPDAAFASIMDKAAGLSDTGGILPTDRPEAIFDALLAALSNLRERGLELPESEIVEYRSPVVRDNGELVPTVTAPPGYGRLARRFVHLFFIELDRLARQTRSAHIGYDAARLFEFTSNQISIVLRYALGEKTFLFTGDADTSVLERLIEEKADISARVLKVPHHGSRENLSRRALLAISPECAIISHGNRRFGRSHDPHPHHEIIDLLDFLSIETHYTNAVVKQKKILRPAASGQALGGLIRFN